MHLVASNLDLDHKATSAVPSSSSRKVSQKKKGQKNYLNRRQVYLDKPQCVKIPQNVAFPQEKILHFSLDQKFEFLRKKGEEYFTMTFEMIFGAKIQIKVSFTYIFVKSSLSHPHWKYYNAILKPSEFS